MIGSGKAAEREISVDVAIIGAGPAGLTAGYLLTKAAKSVAIIEKDATYVGGISRTVEHDGFRVVLDMGNGSLGALARHTDLVDGIDAVLADLGAQRPRALAHRYLPFAADLRGELLDLNRAGHDELRRAALAAKA